MPFKILIVDDQIDNESDEISNLPDMLRAAGYEVRTTADRNQAYDLVWEYNPDLIVLVHLGINRYVVMLSGPFPDMST
jgi:CheY-like chemotaxis protein